MMKGLLVFLVLLVAFLVDAAKKDVVVLTTANFDSVIKSNELVLVEFYAPWCGHCKKLAPEYDKAAKAMRGKKVVLAKVDATEESELGTRFDIKGYPTVKLFRDGVPFDYPGERTAEGIATYLNRQLKPPVSQISSEKELEDFIPDEGLAAGVAAVAYTTESSDLAELLRAVAKVQRDNFDFALVTDPELAQAHGEAMDTLVVYKPFDELKAVYGGPLEVDDVTAFLNSHSLPMVGEITANNYQKYRDRGLPQAWLFLGADDKVNQNAIAAFRGAGKGFREQLSMVYISGETYKQMAKKMGLSAEVFPALTIETTDGAHYVFDETKPLTEENILQYLTDYRDGKIVATVRSQPIPEEPFDADHVRVVVGANFAEVVMDEAKDVLIEFYAPWCGHCKSLAPVYGKLATQLKDIPTLVIAKTDATENDYPAEFKIQGFPTIRLVQAGTNQVIEFNGERTAEGIVKFLRENCAHPFEVPAALADDDDDDDDDDKEDL
eukprot:RCo031020